MMNTIAPIRLHKSEGRAMSSRAKKKWKYRQHGLNYELKRTLISTGVVDGDADITWDMAGKEKMSKVLLDFVAPYTESADSHEEFQRAVFLGLIGWNIALLPANVRKECIDQLIAKAVPANAAADFRDMIDHMVDRKDKYFAENRRYLLAHHWTVTEKGLHLPVVSTLK
jgi:hypothetical protein